MTDEVKEYINSLKDKKVAFVGMGVANAPSALFLAKHGIKIFAMDKSDRKDIGEEICKELDKFNVTFCLGENYLEKIYDMDVIFRSNGILPFQNEWIGNAISKGITVTSEIEVFFKHCPAKLYAITGSNGKTTTTTLISEMLKAQGKKVFIGGNIGIATMPFLEDITKDDFAVCELSSFQLLTLTNFKNRPDVAVVTNIEKTHLDHHISLDEYVDSKRNILIYQNENQKTVLNANCDYSIGGSVYHDMKFDVRGKLFEFSINNEVQNGAYLNDNNEIVYSDNGKEIVVMKKEDIRLPGLHNVENYCTAITAVWDDVSKENMKKVAMNFGGVEHRIEFVRELNGVKYYNDSIATSPSRVISGLRAFEQKIIIIQGGSDKGNDMSQMTDDIIKHTKAVILNGTTVDKIYNAIIENENYSSIDIELYKVENLEQAILKAKEIAKVGDIVSLCPACPAFDQFKTFEFRGRKFKEIVNGFEK